MISLRFLIVVGVLAAASTSATAAQISSVTPSPDPPLALSPFSLQIGGWLSNSCESELGANPATTGPGFVQVDYFVQVAGGVECAQVISPLQDEVFVGPLAPGDYDLTVDLYEVTSFPGDPSDGAINWVQAYTDQFTVVPEPGTAQLVACGLLGLALKRRRDR